MHHLTQQTHVAQQSRREKLRIPGINHTASPHTGHNRDHSVGLAIQVREAQQGAQQNHQSDQEEPFSGLLRGYTRASNQTTTNAMLPLYNSQMMSSDSYNFATGAELLAVPAKTNAYFCSSPADIGSQTPVTAGTVYSGQSLVSGGYPSQKNWFSKSGNWETVNSQLPQNNSSPLNLVRSGGIQGVPVHTSSGASQNVLAATLLLGALQSGTHESSSKDGSVASCNLLGTNVSPEAMQLYLMNNGTDGYVGVPTTGNMVLLSPPNASSLNPLPNGGQAQQNLVEMTFSSAQPSSSRLDRSLGDGSMPSPRATHVYNTLRNGDELLFLPLNVDTQRMKHLTDQANTAKNLNQETYPETGCRIRQNFFSTFPNQQQQLLQAGSENKFHNESPLAGTAYGQCLNLSLSSKRPPSMQINGFDVHLHSEGENSVTSQIDVKNFPIEFTSNLINLHPSRNGEYTEEMQEITNLGDDRQFHFEQDSLVGSASFTFLSRSKYLKGAQQLLDEVCSVRKDIIKHSSPRYQSAQMWKGQNHEDMDFGSADAAIQGSSFKDQTRHVEAMHTSLGPVLATVSSANFTESFPTLSSEERKDCETKKGKLLFMLQEVDRRYRIYSDQMHAVVASFDSVLGVGAAIPYTALALQAMSRYFRCLRDAISGQIQLVCKALGEEEIGRQLTNRGGISRLRYVDQQLRQQRSFQQLGMLQQHAWRPQRGLPERSVSVLRAWLFEHFLHPYPKDADKIMLARQTGLTRSQVSNWFINARVRLWKPMVEEMYQEEARDKGIEAPGKYHGEGENSHSDGITDLGTSDRTCKTESRQDQNYTNMAALDNKITSEGASDLQMFLEGDGLTSEFNPGNISSTRNETMKIGNGYEAQLYEDSNPDGLSPVQMKKSRIGISNHTNLLLNANKGPTTESDEMHNDTSCDVENKTKVATRQDSHIYSIPYNGGQMCHDGSVLTPYEDGNLSRAFTSLYPVNGVSLTLGLRHCDNLSLSANRQSYLHGGQSIAISRRETVGTEKNEYGNSIYEGTGSQISDHQSIDYPNSKHIEMQMLHDFVA